MGGVIAMIDLLVADLTKEMTEAETDEKDAQADYKQMMKDSAAKRATDAKALTAKGAAKSDWLLQYFDARQAARTGEIESLKQAKAVLSGADYSLLQQNVHRAGFLAKKGNTCSVKGEDISADMDTEHNYYSQ